MRFSSICNRLAAPSTQTFLAVTNNGSHSWSSPSQPTLFELFLLCPPLRIIPIQRWHSVVMSKISSLTFSAQQSSFIFPELIIAINRGSRDHLGKFYRHLRGFRRSISINCGNSVHCHFLSLQTGNTQKGPMYIYDCTTQLNMMP